MNQLKKFGVPHPKYDVAATPEEAERIARTIGGRDFVVKAQVLAGGRGKGHFKGGLQGGVHVAVGPEKVKELASKMLGDRLVTKQTGPGGKPCNRVLITERLYFRAEKYFAILMDREYGGPVLVGSPAGGMDIEQVAHDTPHLIFKEPIDIIKGIDRAAVERLATNLGFDTADTRKQATDIMIRLYDLFIKCDSTLVEINPLAETHDGRVVCADAKLNFDANAEFRQSEVFSLRDASQEDPREVDAEKVGLNYIGLDGDIGCLVNGAGLAMATMDVIKLHGGNPANFLDVGGGASAEQVTKAFEILNNDPQVRAILVNIFGGIMRVDTIALGLIRAVTTLGIKKPLVARLAGTNLKEAKKLLEESGLRILTADDLSEAAQKVVRVVEILKMAEDAHVNVSFELPL